MEGNSLGVLLPEMRLDFWDSLLDGQIGSPSVLSRRLKVLELPLSTDSLCLKCVLRLAHGDAYLDHIWRYGRDRLRVAVGNLLPGEDSGILYGVCRLTPRHVYILACATEGGSLSMEGLTEKAQQDITSLTQALEQYLDLESEIKEILPVPTLADLTEQK